MVNSFVDQQFVNAGTLTLRMAIQQANSNDRIDLPAGTYSLNLGPLKFSKPGKVTIEAAAGAQSRPVIDAQNLSGVFQVNKGSEVDFESLWIQRGNTPSGVSPVVGGGIQNYGTVEINNSYLYENTSDLGGGLLNQGTATVTNTVFYGNFANHEGGGVYNTSVISTTNCVFYNNKAGASKNHGAGGGLDNSGVQATITGGTFLLNYAGASGGGLQGESGTTIISNVNFTSNHSDVDGGGVANLGSMAIIGGTFSFNSSSSDGGGAFNQGQMGVNGATFTGNTAGDDGGGIFNDDNMLLNVVNCTISNNTAGSAGGGIYSRGNLLTIDSQTKQKSSGNTPKDFDIS
jgi:predicted outer membrane repeat protein